MRIGMMCNRGAVNAGYQSPVVSPYTKIVEFLLKAQVIVSRKSIAAGNDIIN